MRTNRRVMAAGEPATTAYRVARLARREFRASLMSHTKWRKLFYALLGPASGVRQCIIKLVEGDVEDRYDMPPEILIGKTALLETRYGPVAYVEIEWLELRHQAIPFGEEKRPEAWLDQDIDRAREIIEGLGRYPLEETADGIRINGYVR